MVHGLISDSSNETVNESGKSFAAGASGILIASGVSGKVIFLFVDLLLNE